MSVASRPLTRASELPVSQLVFVARGVSPMSTPSVCAFRCFLPGRVFSDMTTRRHGLSRVPPNWVAWTDRVATLLAKLLERQAGDGRCKEVRASMDVNDMSRFREDSNGLFVGMAPLAGTAQIHVPTHMRYRLIIREHYRTQPGHLGANTMYTSI